MRTAFNILSIITSYVEATANIIVEHRLSAIADQMEKPKVFGL